MFTLIATRGTDRFVERRLDKATADAHAEVLSTQGWNVLLAPEPAQALAA